AAVVTALSVAGGIAVASAGHGAGPGSIRPASESSESSDSSVPPAASPSADDRDGLRDDDRHGNGDGPGDDRLVVPMDPGPPPGAQCPARGRSTRCRCARAAG